MLCTHRAEDRFRRQLDRAGAAVFKQLDVQWFHETPDGALCLAPNQTDTLAPKPTFVLLDPMERRCLFKVATAEMAAAERCAYEIRALARKPTLPARMATLEIEGQHHSGVLKPFVSRTDGEGLSSDSTTWSGLQQSAILTEHVWEWFLGNLDASLSQYALFTAGGWGDLPVNLAWDRSFRERGLPSRLDKYNATLPNAYTYLYADYVEGRTSLELGLLIREAKRIQRLPIERMRPILERYARHRFSREGDRRRWVAGKLTEQRRIESVFKAFVKGLAKERRRLATSAQRRGQANWVPFWCWRQLQFAMNVAGQGPLGNGARRTLRIVRGVWLRVCQFGRSSARPAGAESGGSMGIRGPARAW